MNCRLLGSWTWSISQMHMRTSQGVLVKRVKKGIYFKGIEEERPNIERNKDNIAEREHKKTKFEGTEEQANLLQRNKGTDTPLRGLCISLRRHSTTKVMAYNVTRNLPL